MITPPSRRDPRLLPFLFAAVGIGLLGWFGMSWMDLPRYSESDIELSVEANLAVDLRRFGAAAPDAVTLQRMRANVRAELLADIEREREEVLGGVFAGLVFIALGLAHLLLSRYFNNTRP